MIQYLPLLYLGRYDLSPLLYDINQLVTLLEQLVFLSRRVYLGRAQIRETVNNAVMSCVIHLLRQNVLLLHICGLI